MSRDPGRLRSFAPLLALALLCAVQLAASYGAGNLGSDFRDTLWQAGRDITAGLSPYPDPDDSVAIAGQPAVYPPLLMLVVLPLSQLPFEVAAAVWGALLLGAAILTLAALGVRQQRLFQLWLLSLPVWGCVTWGNATPLILLGAALAWRWRDRPWLVAVSLGATFAIKPLLWPLLVVLAFTGRVRAALLTVPVTLGLLLVPWAVIGFKGMLDYPALVAATTEEHGPNGLLVYAFAVRYVSPLGAGLVALAAAAIALAFAARMRRVDAAAFGFGLLAAVLATPVMWSHYLGIFAIIAALHSLHFSRVWLLVPAVWIALLAPVGQPRPAWMLAAMMSLVVVAAVVVHRHGTIGLTLDPGQKLRVGRSGSRPLRPVDHAHNA